MTSEESVALEMPLVSVSAWLLLESGGSSAALEVGFGLDLVIQHTDAGATSVGILGVPFDEDAIRGITEVPSISVGIPYVSHLALDPRLIIGEFLMNEEMEFRQGRVFTDVCLIIVTSLII